MLAELAADGSIVPASYCAPSWPSSYRDVPPVLDDDGCPRDLLSGQEVEWPPIAN